VPTVLKSNAARLIGSANLLTNDDTGAMNPYHNKLAVESSPYLSNTAISGYSVTAWYLFPNPNDIAAFEIVFLNGVDTPTVEQVDVASNVLGLAYRGYFDFGIAEQDPRGAVKMAGA